MGGLVSQGLGTSMLQMGNIVRNPRIWIPPTLAAAITGPVATCLFRLEMNGAPVSSGMGTCGLVGQIGVYTGWVNDVASGAKAAVTGMDWLGLVLISFVLPAVLTVYFIAIAIGAHAGAEWALNNQTYTNMNSWFHYAKLYAATAGCIGFMMLKYKWSICLLYTSPSPRD